MIQNKTKKNLTIHPKRVQQVYTIDSTVNYFLIEENYTLYKY